MSFISNNYKSNIYPKYQSLLEEGTTGLKERLLRMTKEGRCELAASAAFKRLTESYGAFPADSNLLIEVLEEEILKEGHIENREKRRGIQQRVETIKGDIDRHREIARQMLPEDKLKQVLDLFPSNAQKKEAFETIYRCYADRLRDLGGLDRVKDSFSRMEGEPIWSLISLLNRETMTPDLISCLPQIQKIGEFCGEKACLFLDLLKKMDPECFKSAIELFLTSFVENQNPAPPSSESFGLLMGQLNELKKEDQRADSIRGLFLLFQKTNHSPSAIRAVIDSLNTVRSENAPNFLLLLNRIHSPLSDIGSSIRLVRSLMNKSDSFSSVSQLFQKIPIEDSEPLIRFLKQTVQSALQNSDLDTPIQILSEIFDQKELDPAKRRLFIGQMADLASKMKISEYFKLFQEIPLNQKMEFILKLNRILDYTKNYTIINGYKYVELLKKIPPEEIDARCEQAKMLKESAEKPLSYDRALELIAYIPSKMMEEGFASQIPQLLKKVRDLSLETPSPIGLSYLFFFPNQNSNELKQELADLNRLLLPFGSVGGEREEAIQKGLKIVIQAKLLRDFLEPFKGSPIQLIEFIGNKIGSDRRADFMAYIEKAGSLFAEFQSKDRLEILSFIFQKVPPKDQLEFARCASNLKVLKSSFSLKLLEELFEVIPSEREDAVKGMNRKSEEESRHEQWKERNLRILN